MDLFSIPVLMGICILIVIVSLGLIYYWVNIKLTDQDHKLESMLSLVSTLVGEVNMLKMRPIGGTRPINNFNPVLNDLIEVSSNEDSESDEEEEEDEENEDEDLKTESEVLSLKSVSDDESEQSDDSDEEQSDDEDEEHSVENIKTIHINLEEGNLTDGNLIDDILVSDVNLEEPVDIDLGVSEFVPEDILVEDVEPVIVEDINVVEDVEPVVVEDINVADEHINTTNSETDYKKMSINGLREIVVKKGLVDADAASKLKKNEILKMLH